MIAEARILRLGLGPRRRCGGRSCRCGAEREGGIGGTAWGQLRQTKPIGRAGVVRRCGRAGGGGRPGCAKRTQFLSSWPENKGQAEKQSQFSGMGLPARVLGPAAPNKANLPRLGRFGGAALPARAEGRVAPNKPNFRLLGTENEGRAKKQSQFAGPRWAGASRVGSGAGLVGLSRPWEGVRGNRCGPASRGIGPRCAKQSQFAGGNTEATCFTERRLREHRPIVALEKQSQFAGPGRRASMAGAVACVLGNVGPPTPGGAGLRGSWRPGRRRGSWDRG